jgi:predicted Zn-dependent protease
VTLLSLGKEEEAAGLVDQVRKAAPTDPKLITVLAQALELLGKGNCAIELSDF